MQLKEYQIKDVCKVITGRSPSNHLKHYTTTEKADNYYWLKQADLDSPALYKTKTFFKKDFVNLTRYTDGNNIYLFPDCNLRAFASVIPFCYDCHTWEIIADETKVLKSYLLYCLKNKTKELQRLQSGTVLKRITKDRFQKFKIQLPDLEYQRKVVELIEPIEQKIQLLIKRKELYLELIKLKYYENSTDELIPFNSFNAIVSKPYNNQKYYIDTSNISNTRIRDYEIIIERKTRANLTPHLNSIIFSKLKGEKKLYPIFDEKLLDFVYSTGFMNIISTNPEYVYGWMQTDEFDKLKNATAVGSVQVGLTNGVVNRWLIKKPKNLKNDDYSLLQKVALIDKELFDYLKLFDLQILNLVK